MPDVKVKRAAGYWYAVRLPFHPTRTQVFNREMREKITMKVWVSARKVWLVHQDFVALYLLEAARHGVITHENAVAGIRDCEADRAVEGVAAGLARLGIVSSEAVSLEFVEHCYAFWAQRYHGTAGCEGWLEELRQTYLWLHQQYEERAKAVPVAGPAESVGSPADDEAAF